MIYYIKIYFNNLQLFLKNTNVYGGKYSLLSRYGYVQRLQKEDDTQNWQLNFESSRFVSQRRRQSHVYNIG